MDKKGTCVNKNPVYEQDGFLVWLVLVSLFDGISAFVGYFIPKPSL